MSEVPLKKAVWLDHSRSAHRDFFDYCAL